MISFRLDPVPPYDFAVSMAIFSKGNPQIRSYRDGVFRQAIEIDEQIVLIDVSVKDPGKNSPIHVTARSDEEISRAGEKKIRETINSLFNLSDDLIPFYRAIEKDPVLSGIAGKLQGLKSPTTATVFEALIDSIIEQQISLSVAHTIQGRLIRQTGRSITFRDQEYFCYPTPGILAKVPVETFRSFGMTNRKGEYIHEISQAIAEGELDIERFRNYTDTDEIIDEMIKIRGIGKWTAELTVLRGIHRLDSFPADDVGTRRIIAKYYHGGKRMTADEARRFAERWGKWKGLAAYYLEIAALMEITPEPAPE
jgi:DNA-3-methyladenine glycosylase II